MYLYNFVWVSCLIWTFSRNAQFSQGQHFEARASVALRVATQMVAADKHALRAASDAEESEA